MTSLRTLLFLVGTTLLVSGSEVKINSFQYQPHSPYGIYRLPAEIIEKKSFSLGNIGIPNLASLFPFPTSGISGFLPILGRGEKADCDHSGYIISGQPVPVIIPETPKTSTWIDPIVKEKSLTPIPEAPALPPLALPELPLKIEEPAQAYVTYPAGENLIETPEETKIEGSKPLVPIPKAPILPPYSALLPIYISKSESTDAKEIKPLAPIPEAPVLPPFTLTDAGYYIEASKFIEEDKPLAPIDNTPILPPYSAPLPIYVPEPEPVKFEEVKPLAPIPEAPVLPPFSLTKLPLKVSYESAPIYAPCPPGAYLGGAEKEIMPLAPIPEVTIPEAPVLPPFNAPEPIHYVKPNPTTFEEFKLLAPIPEAPVLPPFIAPVPIFYVKPELTKEEVKPLGPIPEAPVLPPFNAPEPIHYVESEILKEVHPEGPIPEASVLPPINAPEPIYYVDPELTNEEIKPLGSIPEAPVLPPFNAPEPIYYVESELTKEEVHPVGLIPEAPVLPPFNAPEPIYYVESELPKGEVHPASLIPDVSVLPPFNAPEPIYYVEPELTKEEVKPLGPIPEAPVLPPFNAPEPIYYIEPEPTKEKVEPMGYIPEAPVLPKFHAPEPARAEKFNPLAPIPEAPVLPTFTFPNAGYYVETPKFVEEFKPSVPIPEAPVLGPYTLPELPLKVSVETTEPCEKVYEEPAPLLYIPELPAPIENNEIHEAPKIEELKPIPAAPELPPLRLPALPYIEVIPERPKAPELKPIPAAPELPPLSFKYAVSPISAPVVTKVIEEPTKVFFGAFEYQKLASPEFCAHTVLRERVIPKFIEKEGNYKVVTYSVGSELPFNAYNPGFISYIPGYPAATYDLPVNSS